MPFIKWTTAFFKDTPGSFSEKFEVSVPQLRFIMLGAAGLALFLVSSLRLGYLQLAQFNHYASLAQTVRTQVEREASPRGLIYDQAGNLLAGNKEIFSLSFIPARLPDNALERQRQVLTVIKLADLEAEQIKQILESQDFASFQPLTLVQDLNPKTAKKLMEVLPKTSAFRVQRRYLRMYEDPLIFSHILGYVTNSGLQPEGKDGLEKSYNQVLDGQPAKREITVTATGEAQGPVKNIRGKPGNSLVLTIDSALQKKLHQELQEQLEALGVEKGAAVALDPRSGAVRALVSIPGFDSNQISKGLDQEQFLKLASDEAKPFFNRAISGQYPPGSTIKPVIGSAVLEEQIIDPQKEIFVTGQISVPSVYDPDIYYVFKDWKRHGWVDFVKAIAVSSNVYFYTVGGGYQDIEGLGVDRLVKWFGKFGLGRTTGIDLPGESSGFIPTPEWKEKTFGSAWYIGDTYNISIGQGNLMVTPLQVAVYTAAISNGGLLLEPKLVDKVLNQKGEVEAEFGTIARSQVVGQGSSLELVKKGMRRAVLEGSAQLLQRVPAPVAGKTGTAQTSSGPYHGWFTGFAPYNNPELVLTVLVENGGGGTTAAVPVAQRVLEWYFSQKPIK